jgi:preprotein translocase subunit SecA
MRHQTIDDIVAEAIPANAYAEKWDIQTLEASITRILNLHLPVHDWAKEEGIGDIEIAERIIEASDKKMAEKAATTGVQVWRQVEKSILLQMLDQHWKEHLLNLDHLRQGINLRAFGQRDPLNEYKTEAFAMFENMLYQLRESVTTTLSVVEFNLDPRSLPPMMQRAQEPQKMQETRTDPALMGSGVQQQSATVQPFPQKTSAAFDKDDPATWGKVQRNALCPCGSGKKFKQCHGKIG